jgi:hypothetical protein
MEILLNKFDYDLPAELFPVRNRKFTAKMKYQRFDRAADAIRFAIEELPAPVLLGAVIEVDDHRLGHRDILDLYNSADYPLPRSQIASPVRIQLNDSRKARQRASNVLQKSVGSLT